MRNFLRGSRYRHHRTQCIMSIGMIRVWGEGRWQPKPIKQDAAKRVPRLEKDSQREIFASLEVNCIFSHFLKNEMH